MSRQVHWFSIMNSVLIVLFLAFMVAMILLRTLNRDISKYNKVLIRSSSVDPTLSLAPPPPFQLTALI